MRHACLQVLSTDTNSNALYTRPPTYWPMRYRKTSPLAMLPNRCQLLLLYRTAELWFCKISRTPTLASDFLKLTTLCVLMCHFVRLRISCRTPLDEHSYAIPCSPLTERPELYCTFSSPLVLPAADAAACDSNSSACLKRENGLPFWTSFARLPGGEAIAVTQIGSLVTNDKSKSQADRVAIICQTN